MGVTKSPVKDWGCGVHFPNTVGAQEKIFFQIRYNDILHLKFKRDCMLNIQL